MKILACFLVSVLVVPVIMFSNKTASANSLVVNYNDFTNETNAILADFTKFDERLAGSVEGEKSEKKASEYILNYLKTNTSLIPKNGASVKDGVQTFEFESEFSGLYETSQNIIFEYNPSEKTAKKVILGCNYDAFALKLNESGSYYDQVNTEGVNTSAGSVAALLALAKFLPYSEINFNIEFVFYGAGESSNAGANIYAQGISDEDVENILCAINLDNVALGTNLYFYSDEVETDFSKFVSNVSNTNKIGLKQVNVTNLNKIAVYESKLNLDYTHVAMESENLNYMSRGIVSLNIFAGDYENGIIAGRREYANLDAIAYTTNDTIAYITDNLDFENVSENLYKVFRSVSGILTNENFETAATNAKGQSIWVYDIFANKKLVAWLTLTAFVLFVMIAMFVHYKLSVKAYNANVEIEFLSSVVKISESIDEGGIDENVPKVVGQVLANDIKKDKVIKTKKKKK